MTIQLPDNVEDQLRTLAEKQGRDVAVLAEEAIRLYLEAVAITDLGPGDIAQTQEKLLSELPGIPDWEVSDG